MAGSAQPAGQGRWARADQRRALSKGESAPGLLEAVRAENVPRRAKGSWATVACGLSGPLREGLAERGFLCVPGGTGEMVVFPGAPRWVEPGPGGGGRPRRRHRLDKDGPQPLSLRAGVAQTPWRKVTWREGTRGSNGWTLCLVAGEGWPAHGWATGDGAHEEPFWLLIEEQANGAIKDAFSNLPAGTSRLRAVRRWHQRWKIEQGCQQMKEELGLDHFEGRSWRGFHHHATLVMLAFGFLALEQRRAKTKPPPRKKPAVAPALSTLPSIRRTLQQLLAPVARHECPYCRPFNLSDQLTESY